MLSKKRDANTGWPVTGCKTKVDLLVKFLLGNLRFLPHSKICVNMVRQEKLKWNVLVQLAYQ